MSTLVTRRGVPAAGTAGGPVVFLVGGYDGSGNGGDLLLAQAAIEVVRRVARPVLVLERAYADHHDANLARWPELAGAGVALQDDGPVDRRRWAPADLGPHQGALATYLYGGGYLTEQWGPRKLAMVRAADGLAHRELPLLCSGVQADPDWLARLPEADAALLDRAHVVGVRDAASAPLGGGAPVTGDDAVAVIAAHAIDGARSATGGVNVHLGEHGWVTADAERLRAYITTLVAALGLDPRPVVAYDDRATSERASAARFGDEALALAPATLPRLADARLTVSSSFHVALSSLLLGVPAALVADSRYYAQKAAGLRADFGLGKAWVLDPAGDPHEAAGALAAELADPGLGERLARAREQLLERRAGVEREVVRMLTGWAPEPSPSR